MATDFSAAANNALRYAAQMALATGKALHVVHVQMMPPAAGMLPALADPLPDLLYPPLYGQAVEQGGAELEGCRHHIAERFPGLTVSFEQLAGTDLAEALSSAVDAHHPEAVILGTHQRNGFFARWGSQGLPLVRSIEAPLIAVPETFATHTWQRAVLATDGHGLSERQQTALTALRQLLGFRLDLVQVQTKPSANPVFPDIGLPEAHTHLVHSGTVADGLEQFLRTSGSDLLLVLPHDHSFWERLFAKEHTLELVSGLPVPVCCLPEKEPAA